MVSKRIHKNNILEKQNVISLISHPFTRYAPVETFIWSEEKIFQKKKKNVFFHSSKIEEPN